MGNIDIESLKSTLPNFPEEILGDWLLPYARSEGWPPADAIDSAPKGRWRYLLAGRTIAQLLSITWQEQQRHISIHELREDYKEISILMVLGAVEKQRNQYSLEISDLSDRFNSILDFVRKTGALPKPPVLLSTEAGFQVLDGNHRLAAYFYAYGYFKLHLDFPAFDSASSNQRLWIGTSCRIRDLEPCTDDLLEGPSSD